MISLSIEIGFYIQIENLADIMANLDIVMTDINFDVMKYPNKLAKHFIECVQVSLPQKRNILKGPIIHLTRTEDTFNWQHLYPNNRIQGKLNHADDESMEFLVSMYTGTNDLAKEAYKTLGYRGTATHHPARPTKFIWAEGEGLEPVLLKMEDAGHKLKINQVYQVPPNLEDVIEYNAMTPPAIMLSAFEYQDGQSVKDARKVIIERFTERDDDNFYGLDYIFTGDIRDPEHARTLKQGPIRHQVLANLIPNQDTELVIVESPAYYIATGYRRFAKYYTTGIVLDGECQFDEPRLLEANSVEGLDMAARDIKV